jgi:hypothetical protein
VGADNRIDLNSMEKAVDRAAMVGPRTQDKRKGPNRHRQQFTKFPDSWSSRLRSARGVTYRVALSILRQHWKTNGQPFRLSNAALEKEGVGRHSKWRALQELEEAGLIRVEMRPRKSPVVTVLVE